MFRTLHEFYNSKQWRSLRERLTIERSDKYGGVRCEHCAEMIENDWEVHAHHKIELTLANVNDYAVSLNGEEIMLVHHKCHNEIHSRWGSTSRKVYLVHGAPCAGKLTHVERIAGPHDLVLDIDKLWQSVSGISVRYVKSDRLKRVVFSAWDNLLDSVKTRNGDWINAYIIMTVPLVMERERLVQRLGCELIHIDTDKQTCIERAASERPKEYLKHIEVYFEKFQPPQGKP